LAKPADHGQSAFQGFMREALAYERGLLEDLPPGLGAPRCFGHAEHGSQHQLWLEDLVTDAIRWRLDDYGKAARSLGRFNGAYLAGRSLPVAGWLSRQWLRSWLAEGAAAVHELPRFRRHPLVQRVYPPEVLDRLLWLWAHRQELLDALDRLPQVLGHNDAFRRNLFLRSERLFAGDWAFLGPAPVAALNNSPGARAFYDRQLARGATHYQALRTLANRLVGILHGCLRSHTLYDEHLAWRSEPDKLSRAA
jgi:hypothetical protein